MRKRASGTFLAAKSEEAVLRGQAAQGAAIPPGGPRRSKVRFAPAYFLFARKNKPSTCSFAPPFSQKVTLGVPVRLQAPSRRLAVATNFLRVAEVQLPSPKIRKYLFYSP